MQADSHKGPSMPEFIQNIKPETLVFISEDDMRVNKERNIYYINPLGYAFHELTEGYTIEVNIMDNGYDFFDQFLTPIAVEEGPKNWLEAPVNIRTVDTYPYEDEEEISRQHIAQRWKNYLLEDVLDGIVVSTNSLERRGVDEIPTVPNIILMKKYFIERLLKESDYLQFEPVLTILENILDEDADEKRSKDLLDFYEDIQKIVDQRFKKVMLPQKQVLKNARKSLEEITCEELEANFDKYSDDEINEFIDSLNGDSSPEDLQKGTFIRNKRQKA